MELTFEREELWRAMQVAGNVAASRNTLPILSNVLIRATDDHIQLAATDLEVGMKSVVQGEIGEAGSITVPAKKLVDIVRELPARSNSGEPAKVKLTTMANDRVEINCENARFRIVGLTDEEFPSLPDIGDDFFTVNSSMLRDMIQKTAFAVSTEETRHFLNGVYLRATPDSMTMVATDGRRLAVATQHQSGSVENEIGVIVPTKAINNILRTFTVDEDVKVALLENQIAFATENTTLISRLIEGEYPDYEAVMAPVMSNEIDVVADTERLLAVIRRVSLLSSPNTPSIKMEAKETELTVSASTPELGEAQEQMEVKNSGGSVEIAFNARFVMDVLRNIESEEVVLKFRDSLSPVLVTPSQEADEEHGYMCVIMPMRV
jgi:DNA polymerase-3 subunit beta